MNAELKLLCDELKNEIQSAYEQGVTLERAERLAAKFLGAQLLVAEELSVIDLESRVRKTSVKALRGAVYLEEATRHERKPSDVMIEAIVNKSALVQGEQQIFDELDVEKNLLEYYLGIFKDAHIFMRGVSRGRFE